MIKSKKRNLDYVKRANDPSKTLSLRARNLATYYYNMLSNTGAKSMLTNNHIISSITEVLSERNRLIHHELRDLFNIKYHKSIMAENVEYKNVFTIEFTENTEKILENPKKFYSAAKISDSKLCKLEHEQPVEMDISDNIILQSPNTITISDIKSCLDVLDDIKLFLQAIQ